MAFETLHEALSRLYYSQQHGYTSPPKLLRALKKEGLHKATLKQVERWYSTQSVPGRFRQKRRHFPRSITISRYPDYQWCSDLGLFLNLRSKNRGMQYLVLIHCAFSRKIRGAIPTRTKQSSAIAEALRKTIQEVGKAPRVLYTDGGGEYLGKCREVYDEFGIRHWISSDSTGPKSAISERLLRLFKEKLYKLMSRYRTSCWTRFVNEVKENINNEYSRSLNMTRNEAHLPKNQNAVFTNTVTRKEIKTLSKIPPNKFKYSINQIVRISKDQGVFSKGFQGSFTEALYVIKKKEMRGGVAVYTLADFLLGMPIRGKFYEAELRPVHNVTVKQKVHSIHSFRLSAEGQQEIQVTLEGSKIRQWLPYSELVSYNE